MLTARIIYLDQCAISRIAKTKDDFWATIAFGPIDPNIGDGSVGKHFWRVGSAPGKLKVRKPIAATRMPDQRG